MAEKLPCCRRYYAHALNCPQHPRNRGNKEDNMDPKTNPTSKYTTSHQEQYEDAKQLIKKVSAREAQLLEFKTELGNLLRAFTDAKFKKFPNTEVTGMIFAGVHMNGKLVVGASKCSHGDDFSELIGKLIAVRRALNKETKDIYEFLDRNNDIRGIK